MLKMQKLGIEWGAAYEEAQPHKITTSNSDCVIFESEKGRLIIETTCSVKITKTSNGMEISLV